MLGSAFGAPLQLTPTATEASHATAVALPAGGAVSWVTGGRQGVGVFSLPIGADGLPGATQQLTDSFVPVSADAGGDQVFEPAPSAYGYPGGPVFVRPAGGGPDQAAPQPGGSAAPAAETVAAAFGRAVAAAWSSSSAGAGTVMALSVWRP